MVKTTPVFENMEYLAVHMWFQDFMLLLIIWQNSIYYNDTLNVPLCDLILDRICTEELLVYSQLMVGL